MILLGAALVASHLLPVPRVACGDATLEHGGMKVKLNTLGVLTEVAAEGVLPEFGPRVAIATGFHEWVGVSFDTPVGRVSAVATGSAPDYGGRRQVEPVSFSATRERATAVTRLDAVEIQSDFWFERFTGELVVNVTLTNRGTQAITNIICSREWELADGVSATFPAEYAGALPPLPPPPAVVHRVAWMPNNVLPGRSQSVAFGYVQDQSGGRGGVDLPLRMWTSAQYPNGLNFGASAGITLGDFDHDGRVDVYCGSSGNLWRDVDGVDWQFVQNLEDEIGNSRFRYSAAMADYDDDQRPDLGTEPRNTGDNCMHLLHNLGGGQFDEVADDPAVVDVQPCLSDSETMCVADVDGDGDLDWFLPTYPASLGSPGNWFLENLGPVGTGGAYAFHEDSRAAGLDNPDNVNRPEGAEFVDVDEDGDVDLYSNGTLYRNRSPVGVPRFDPMTENATGIVFSDVLDEGAVFLDYDTDGDLDLLIAFTDASIGLRIFESRGDGTFFLTKKSTFDSNDIGLNFGVSCADWDNDGDVDVTSKQVFRRNMWVEEGQRHFIVATHSLDPDLITSATPGWLDWDRDGDLDTAIGDISAAFFYENTLYDAATPADQRRSVRVRVVRDSPLFDDGLESEFGAQVAVAALGADDDGMKRVQVVTTAGGYLNQPEYTLTFSLPPDPDPADPESDLHFAVSVDFKGSSKQDFPRVDRHVNPVLGDIDLAALDEREIVVYRSGRVKIDGCDFHPAAPAVALITTTKGLVAPDLDAPLAPPVTAPGSDWFVGIEVSTAAATVPQRIEELLLDGALDAGVDCGGGELANLFVWDVTDPTTPLLVSGGAVERATLVRNDRSFLPLDVTFAPGRLYRVVARVKLLRPTPISGPVVNGEFTTNGGLSFQDAAPCTGAGASNAIVDPANVYLALRFRPEPAAAWADMGHALAGTHGDPLLSGSGELRGGTPYSLDLTNGLENAPLIWVFGLSPDCIPFAGGAIVPSLDLIVGGSFTDHHGTASLTGNWPTGLPGGETFYIQAFLLDPVAIHGFAMSNAVAGTTPY